MITNPNRRAIPENVMTSPMPSDTLLSYQRLLELFRYESETGKFYQLSINKEVGYLGAGGRYFYVFVEGVPIRRARLAWFYIYGKWPEKHIDHINGNKFDDRISNLREANNRENNSNLSRHRNGYLVGTTWNKLRQKWLARIKTNGVTTNLGYFKTQQEAHEAYKVALSKL